MVKSVKDDASFSRLSPSKSTLRRFGPPPEQWNTLRQARQCLCHASRSHKFMRVVSHHEVTRHKPVTQKASRTACCCTVCLHQIIGTLARAPDLELAAGLKPIRTSPSRADTEVRIHERRRKASGSTGIPESELPSLLCDAYIIERLQVLLQHQLQLLYFSLAQGPCTPDVFWPEGGDADPGS